MVISYPGASLHLVLLVDFFEILRHGFPGDLHSLGYRY
jgi:hypothetical protein